MARYPFNEKATEYMETRRGCIADTSWRVQDRRYRRMERELIQLNKEGKVKTLSPAKMDSQDVKEFLLYRKSQNVSSSDLSHDISALDQLLQFSGNTAVQNCLQRNTGLKPVKKQARLSPLSEKTYERILQRWEEIDQSDIYQVRPVAMVLMYIGTGARNKELRLAKVEDLDTEEWMIHFEHVKGEDSYGEPRDVPIPTELVPIIKQYLVVRDAWLICHKARSEYLFFAMDGVYAALSGNGIRTLKAKVEVAIGERFELRDCRRFCGQHYLDKGLTIEEVARLLGHYTTKTTEIYYCRRNNAEVARRAKGVW